MIAWLYNLLIGSCFGHKWHIIKENRVNSPGGSSCARYYLQCTKCGNIKIKDGN